MSKQIFRVNNTTFADIISMGAFTILESFVNVLKDEIVKGNMIIIVKYEDAIDTNYQLEINTLEELEEFKNYYLS
jgi:hypothetical protein